MNNQEINKTQGKKANTMHSLKMKIFLLVFIAIIFAIGLCLLMIVPKSKSNLETVIENYMKDIQPGGSIDVCEPFELQDTSDVDIEVSDWISFDGAKDTQLITIEE